MTAKGHVLLASSITLGSFIFIVNTPSISRAINIVPPYSIVFFIAVIVGSLLPDIDESESYVGRRLKIISVIVSSVFKHRTFTHYLIVPLVLTIVAIFVSDAGMQTALFGLAFGILLHDAGDMLTKGGIKGFLFPFFPNTKIALLPEFIRFRTFSIQEYIFIYLFLVPINIYFIYLLSSISSRSIF